MKQPELVTFSPRESHTMTISTGEIYVFGGCYLGQRCFNEILRLEEKGGSSVCGEPRNQCSGHGQCRMYWNRITNASVHGCACEPGWVALSALTRLHVNMCSGGMENAAVIRNVRAWKAGLGNLASAKFYALD